MLQKASVEVFFYFSIFQCVIVIFCSKHKERVAFTVQLASQSNIDFETGCTAGMLIYQEGKAFWRGDGEYHSKLNLWIATSAILDIFTSQQVCKGGWRVQSTLPFPILCGQGGSIFAGRAHINSSCFCISNTLLPQCWWCRVWKFGEEGKGGRKRRKKERRLYSILWTLQAM